MVYTGEQMYIQSKAEQQGAGAWQTLKGLYPDRSKELDALSEIQIGNADYLDVLLPVLK
jgi:hypothetical protein